MIKYTLFLFLLLLAGCTSKPAGVVAVENFELNRYLGKWYEIARLDHSFERGLDNITAEYTLRDDGGVKVVNSGYSKRNKEWSSAEGKAYFVDESNQGHLKVSFFGPFYGSYIIFELEKDNYEYAFISGPNTSYLWLLARTPSVSKETINLFINRASSLGFETDELIFVEHYKPNKL